MTGMQGLKRSCYCGQVTSGDVDATLTLTGWAHRRRDHGGVIFVDLRDREGLVQIVFDPAAVGAEVFRLAESIRRNAGHQLGSRAEIEYDFESWDSSGSADFDSLNTALKKFQKKL